MDSSMIRFDAQGLVPVVAQDCDTGAVLMLAYANAEALDKTAATGLAHYYSRSRAALWQKGETSGHVQRVQAVLYDCDGDAVLYRVRQKGPACHTNNPTCFFRSLYDSEPAQDAESVAEHPTGAEHPLEVEQAVIIDRRRNPQPGSYTNYLFNEGLDKILKKVGEESAEVIIAAKNRNADELRYETADLLYHLSVLLTEMDMQWADIFAEAARRRKNESQ